MAGNRKKPRKNPGFVRYNSEKRWIKNKELRAERHKKLVSVQIEVSERRRELLSQVREMYNASEYQLKRLAGTLNERRLSSLLDGTFSSKTWFQSRTLTPTLQSIINRTKFRRADLDMMTPFSSENEENGESNGKPKRRRGLHKSANRRNKKVSRGAGKKARSRTRESNE